MWLLFILGSDRKRRLARVFGFLPFAAAFLTPSHGAYAEVPPAITVNGVAEVTVLPDMATVNFGISYTDTNPAEALRRISETTEQVISALICSGVTEENIRTVSVDVSPNHVWNYGRATVVDFSASTSLRVTVFDLELLGGIIAVTMQAGATSVGQVQFSLSDTEAAYNEALAIAFRSARRKADSLAAAAEARIIGISSIAEQSAWQPPVVARAAAPLAVQSDQAEAFWDVPIATGELQIRATITVVFLIAP